MTGSRYQKASAFLWLVLAAGMVVELAVGAWHGAWGLHPLLPAVLSGGVFQRVTSARKPGEYGPVPLRALVLIMITSALALISSAAAWVGGGVSERTSALVAAVTTLFFLGGLISLQVRALGVGH